MIQFINPLKVKMRYWYNETLVSVYQRNPELQRDVRVQRDASRGQHFPRTERGRRDLVSAWPPICELQRPTFYKAHEPGEEPGTQGCSTYAITMCNPQTPHETCVMSVSQTDVCVMDLRGAASAHNMYLYGGDPLKAPTESLLPPLVSSPLQLTGIVFICNLWSQ